VHRFFSIESKTKANNEPAAVSPSAKAGLPEGLAKILVYFTAIWSGYFTTIWSILRPFGLFYDHLVYFTAIGYIFLTSGTFCGNLVYFSCFGMLYQEESGNQGCGS
jgi:hypothetical protein